jgi:hypothetical protein
LGRALIDSALDGVPYQLAGSFALSMFSENSNSLTSTFVFSTASVPVASALTYYRGNGENRSFLEILGENIEMDAPYELGGVLGANHGALTAIYTFIARGFFPS